MERNHKSNKYIFASSESYESKLDECFKKANHLISACQLPFPTVTSLCDLNSHFFITLFRAISPVPLLDLKEPKTIEDETHNVQMVIDTFSLDVIQISLQHICGEDIVVGNVTAICNLLEIFEAYLSSSSSSSSEALKTVGSKLHVGDLKTSSSSEEDVSHRNKKRSISGVSHDERLSQKIYSLSSSPQESYKDLARPCSSKKGLSEVEKAQSISQISYDSHAVTPLQMIYSSSDSPQESYKDLYRSSSDKKDLPHIKQTLSAPIPISCKLPEGPFQRTHASFSSIEESYRSMRKSSSRKSSSSNYVSTNRTRSSAEDLEESSSFETCMRPIRLESWQEETIPKRKIHVFSSSDESTMKDQMIQTSDSLLFKKPRSIKEDTMEDENDLIGLYRQNTEKKLKLLMESVMHDDIKAKAIKKAYLEALSPSYLRKKSLRRCKKSFLLPTDLRRSRRTPHKTLKRLEKSPQVITRSATHQRSSNSGRRTDEQSSEKSTSSSHQTTNQRPCSSSSSSQELQSSYENLVSGSHQRNLHLHSTPSSSPKLRRLQKSRKGNGENEPPAHEEQTYDDTNERAFFQKFRKTFSAYHISENIFKSMENQYLKHLIKMYNDVKDDLLKKTPAQVQTEEALKKQKALAEIVQKDLDHACRLNDFKESRNLAQMFKSKIRDANLESAKIKQYYEKYYKDHQRKMKRVNDKEEMMLKNLFNEALGMQKEDVRDLRDQLKERQAKETHYHKIYLEALENLYQNQFDLLAESLANENKSTVMRTRAQEKILREKNRERRQKMEREIDDMQENILRNQNDVHFFELDIQRFREDMAKH